MRTGRILVRIIVLGRSFTSPPLVSTPARPTDQKDQVPPLLTKKRCTCKSKRMRKWNEQRYTACARRYHRYLLAACLAFVGSTAFWRSIVATDSLPLTIQLTQPTNYDVCRNGHYKGILLIKQGDREGAAGTIFYLFVLNQLLYAERHAMFPWIHLSPYSHHIHDAQVHGEEIHVAQTFVTAPAWWQINTAQNQCPSAPPITDADAKQWRLAEWKLAGTGVWSSYFQPLFAHHNASSRPPPPSSSSSSRPSPIPSCLKALPLVTLTTEQILYGLHLQCPWSVRAWRYGGLSPALRQPKLDLHTWLGKHRQKAASIVQRYYRWQPDLRARIDILSAPWYQRKPTAMACLGLHIRHSDKANKRKRIPVDDFLPYLQVYAQRIPHGHVFLATDSNLVVEKMQAYARLFSLSLHWQPNIIRSNDTSPVFTQASHDVTNRQVLIDIGVLSRSTFLIHGLSAVSEAAIYHNVELHERSINLEAPSGEVLSPVEFEHMIIQWQKQETSHH